MMVPDCAAVDPTMPAASHNDSLNPRAHADTRLFLPFISTPFMVDATWPLPCGVERDVVAGALVADSGAPQRAFSNFLKKYCRLLTSGVAWQRCR
ncbi:hypothetical protein ACTMU2_18615 [Cupriavidus basilensis]